MRNKNDNFMPGSKGWKSPEQPPYVQQGRALQLPIQWFQLLYREVGWHAALDIGVRERFILWPRDDDPPEHLLYRAALEVDKDEVKFPENVERAFYKRWDAYARAIALRTIRGTAELSRTYTALASDFMRKAKDGEIDGEQLKLLKETTSLLMHANNGTGFIYRELVGGTKKDAGQTMQVGRLVINAGPQLSPKGNKLRPPKAKEIKRAMQAPIIDAVAVKELPVGDGGS